MDPARLLSRSNEANDVLLYSRGIDEGFQPKIGGLKTPNRRERCMSVYPGISDTEAAPVQ